MHGSKGSGFKRNAFGFQTAVMLLRIDDIVSGSKKKQDDTGGQTMPEDAMM